jgi:aminomethyltransferase
MSEQTTPLHRTLLYPEHRRLGAKMVDFHGWEMPVYYSSILDEHKQVRTAAGLFDVSHMGHVFMTGPDALRTLNHLMVSDLTQVSVGRACYTLMLDERGGILDDVIVFRIGDQEYLVVVNCANRQQDVGWMVAHTQGRPQIADHSTERGILAVQGPQAVQLIGELAGPSAATMARFDVAPLAGHGPSVWLSRTGYTGSDGFEIFAPNAVIVTLWKRLMDEAPRAQPIGLGARDTLRLEAGLRLCGTDMDQTTSPYEADLGWTVALGKPAFIGREVLLAQKTAGVARRLVGFALEQGPVPRHECPLLVGERQVGAVTSGTFSLMLNKPIGMGYVERGSSAPGTTIHVKIRTTNYPATIVKMPFWKPEPAQPAVPSTTGVGG